MEGGLALAIELGHATIMDPGVLAVLALHPVFVFEATLSAQVVFLEVCRDHMILTVQPGEIGGAVRDVLEIGDAQHVAGGLRLGDAAARDVPVVHGIARRGDRETKALQLLFGTVHRVDPYLAPCNPVLTASNPTAPTVEKCS